MEKIKFQYKIYLYFHKTVYLFLIDKSAIIFHVYGIIFIKLQIKNLRNVHPTRAAPSVTSYTMYILITCLLELKIAKNPSRLTLSLPLLNTRTQPARASPKTRAYRSERCLIQCYVHRVVPHPPWRARQKIFLIRLYARKWMRRDDAPRRTALPYVYTFVLRARQHQALLLRRMHGIWRRPDGNNNVRDDMRAIRSQDISRQIDLGRILYVIYTSP